jgi:hypothetical protein
VDVLLSRPLIVDGKKLSKTITVQPEIPAAGEQPAVAAVLQEALSLDLEALTGKDIDLCVNLAQMAKGDSVRVLVTDLEFHIQLAARASGIDAAQLKKLPARDYVEVATSIQAFLTGSA